MQTLILTSCTGEKRFKPPQALTFNDFQDSQRLTRATQQLQDYICPATELYTGLQHRYVQSAVHLLRQKYQPDRVDLNILSAGYGLLAENEMIAPYNVTFNQLKGQELDSWAQKLGLHAALEKAIAPYDLVFVLLGKQYLRALSLPITSRPEQTLIFLASPNAQRYIPELTAKVHQVHLSHGEAKTYHCALVGLKGFLLEQFAKRSSAESLEELHQLPERFIECLGQPDTVQLNLPIEVRTQSTRTVNKINYPKSITIPASSPTPNQHFGMQYFIPEWDDLVDPTYDFVTDTGRKQNFYTDQVYAHEIYETPNYDGILMSRAVIEAKKSKAALVREFGVQQFLRFPKANIMGDCGAFSYIEEEVPPYSIDDVLSFYDSLGFTYGVSVDHLIVGPFAQPGERERRYDLTLKNGEIFLQQHRERGYEFMPIGAVQGWSPETYAAGVKEFIRLGYEYIGLGGLVRSQSQEIYRILEAVAPVLTAQTRLHLFGVARLGAMEAFHNLGVTSVDSASPLRKAWLGSADTATNYHTLSGKKYTAIRVPPVTGNKAKKVLRAGIIALEQLQSLEQAALQALRDYDAGCLSLEVTLEAVLEYETILDKNVESDSEGELARREKRDEKRYALYQEVLAEQPWKQCDCKVCRDLGIEVIIFRNNNRNRRRGFHNTYIFNHKFLALFKNLRNHN